MILSRRNALKSATAGLLLSASLPGLAFGRALTDRRLVVVFLRGGVDGLSLVPPYGDPLFRKVRGILADDNPGSGGNFDMHDLDGFFALNHDLPNIHAMYKGGDALVVHATTTGYRERSHFDAQDALDRGAVTKEVDTGWLNRTLGALPTAILQGREQVALGLGPTLPYSLRGPNKVGNWSPPVEPSVSADTLERLSALYDKDDKMGPTLRKARSASDMAKGMGGGDAETGMFETLAAAAASFLKLDEGPRIATIDYGNWDSHSDQNRRNVPGPENAYYAGRFPEMYLSLDRGLQALKEGLGEVWSKTAVLVVTEFGRTVHVNGTAGTDHGTAGAALLLGGAVKGGRVIADWRGLGTKDLYEERDLYPTADTRGLMKAILHDHFGVAEAAIEDTIFPDSRQVRMFEGIFRA